MHLTIVGDDIDDRDYRGFNINAEVAPGFPVNFEWPFSSNKDTLKALEGKGPAELRCLNTAELLLDLPGVEYVEFRRYCIGVYKGADFLWGTNDLAKKVAQIICSNFYGKPLEEVEVAIRIRLRTEDGYVEIAGNDDERGGGNVLACIGPLTH